MDSTGDIHKFTRGLARACERHGAKFRADQSVRAIENGANGLRIRVAAVPADEGKCSDDIVDADGVVICAGIASRKLARSMGDRLNVYPVKGYSITVNLSNELAKATAPWVSLLDDDAKIVTSRLGPDRLRVAGTAELNDFNRDISAARIKPLISWTRRQFPEVHTDNVVPWAGLRPMLPSMMPAVRASRRPRIFYNTGHGHLGWTLAGITARMVVNLVSQQLPR